MTAHASSDESQGKKISLLLHILYTKVICQHRKTSFSFFPVVFTVSIVSQYAFAHCLDAKLSTSEDPQLVEKLRIKSFKMGKQL